MAFGNMAIVAEDLERDEIWWFTKNRKGGTGNYIHLFRMGEQETLCGSVTVRYTNNGRPDKSYAIHKRFTGFHENLYDRPYCGHCVDAYGKILIRGETQ